MKVSDPGYHCRDSDASYILQNEKQLRPSVTDSESSDIVNVFFLANFSF